MKNTTSCNRKAASKFSATQRKIAEFLYQKDRAFIPFDIRMGSLRCMPEYYDAIEELEDRIRSIDNEIDYVEFCIKNELEWLMQLRFLTF